MKRTVLFLSIALATVCLASCGGGSSSSSSSKGPESVVKKAITAIQKGDFDAYAATFDLDESDQKMLSGFAQEKLNEAISEKGGLKSFDIKESSVDGDEAKVTVHMIYKDGSEEDQTMDFKKVDNEWKQVMKK